MPQFDRVASRQEQLPATHAALVGSHACPQVPQFALSCNGSTQPSAQSVWVAGHWQVPPLQIELPGQAWPHVPQFAPLLETSTHAPLHSISLAAHWQTPPAQAWPAPHGWPHMPQLAGSERVFAQLPTLHSTSPESQLALH